jgi:DNA polymerase IV
MKTPKILHLDLDAFFCAVEEQENPDLVGKPFAVGGRPEERGVVASCSYAARKYGIRSAMPTAAALRLCPDLIVIHSRHGSYSEISRQVMERLRDLTPLVEQVSIDEAFLDVSDLPETADNIARKIQKKINNELNLPCSIGVAANKLVAKIANDVGKAAVSSGKAPNAVTVVPPGMEAEFLAPLPVQALYGVGPKTAQKMAGMGIRTIGDLAHFSIQELSSRFGKNGAEISSRARGIDDRPIVTTHVARSISQETTFARDINHEGELRKTLLALSEGVGRQLRQSHFSSQTIRLKLRWPDFTTVSRQTTLSQPTDQDETIFQTALSLFYKEWRPGRAVRLLGVGASGLCQPIRQLSFWDVEYLTDRRLQEAIDSLRGRFGTQIVKRGK